MHYHNAYYNVIGDTRFLTTKRIGGCVYQYYRVIFFFIVAVQVSLAFLLSIAMAAPAKPTSVVLYPKGGWVQVLEKRVLQDSTIYFELPSGSQLETLQINIDGQYIGNIETKPIVSIESPIVAKLRDQYRKAAQEVASIQGKLAGIKAKIALWSKPESINSSIEDIKKLDDIMGSKLEELYVAKSSIIPELKQAEFRLKMIEDALKEVGGNEQPAIGVTAFVPLKKEDKSDYVHVQYGYMFQNCGWKPVYQVNAVPEKNIVQIVQNADVHQSSGQDWSDVDVILASVDIGGVLIPPHLFPWIIRPRPEIQPHSNFARVASGPIGMSTNLPIINEEASFTTWNLGKISVVAGISTQIPLYKGDWKADFFRLLRPSLQEQAYLVAKVQPPESVNVLPGMCQFMVDDKVVGSGRLNFMDNKQSIYFGVDQQVTAKMFLDKSQSGQGGFIDKKQSHVWSWNITVINTHNTSVKVLVEDPAPQAADSSIIITADSMPQASIKEHNYLWNLTIPENGKQIIRHKVIMTAPNTMQIIEGR